MAATLEPHRAALRSYLAKSYSNSGDLRRASQEIVRAKELDLSGRRHRGNRKPKHVSDRVYGTSVRFPFDFPASMEWHL